MRRLLFSILILGGLIAVLLPFTGKAATSVTAIRDSSGLVTVTAHVDNPSGTTIIIKVLKPGTTIVLAKCSLAYKGPGDYSCSLMTSLNTLKVRVILDGTAIFMSNNVQVTSGPSPSPSPTAPGHRPVGIVVFENKEVTEITSSKAPYLTSLANQYTRLSNMFGIRHPSLPNYLAMIGGSTFGITNDCTSCHVNATNLVDQLEAAGFSWKAYMEDAPGPCPTIGNNGSYYKKHDPFMYFDDIANNPARCNKVVPYTQLKTDLANHFLPDFFFITPNICHDMHDCSIATGDTWAKNNLPQVINALGTNGILFVTFDEGSTNAGCCGNAAGGHIYTAIVGPGAKTSNVVTTAVDHYSMLRLVEDQFGVAHLRNAATAPAINGALK